MTGLIFISLIVLVLVLLYSAWLFSRLIDSVNDKNKSSDDHVESIINEIKPIPDEIKPIPDEMKSIVDEINEKINKLSSNLYGLNLEQDLMMECIRKLASCKVDKEEKTSEDESSENPVLDIEFISHDGKATSIPDMVSGVRLKGKTYTRTIEYNDEGKWFIVFKDREYIDNEINKINKMNKNR